MARGDRAPARTKGTLYNKAPIAMLDATINEIATAIFSLAIEAGVAVGRGCGYDSLKDEYTVMGKSLTTGRIQDFKVAGESVAALIGLSRMLNGGKLESRLAPRG